MKNKKLEFKKFKNKEEKGSIEKISLSIAFKRKTFYTYCLLGAVLVFSSSVVFPETFDNRTALLESELTQSNEFESVEYRGRMISVSVEDNLIPLSNSENVIVDVRQVVPFAKIEEELEEFAGINESKLEQDIKAEEAKKKAEEEAKRKAEEAKKKAEEDAKKKKKNVILTFYTDLESENGKGLSGRNAINGYLSSSSIAAPKDIPFGTKIELADYGTRYVDDRGGSKIRVLEGGTIRLDVFVPRIAGEDDNKYWQRVNNMGVVETTAYFTYPEN